MTTLSRRCKLSKNILFYLLQRHGSESGEMAANLRRGSESMLWNMTSKQKFILFQNIFCYHAKYWDFSQLLPKTGVRGDQVPQLLCLCVGITIWIILLFVLYEPDFVIHLSPSFSINLFKLHFVMTTINTTNSKITRAIEKTIFLKNKK